MAFDSKSASSATDPQAVYTRAKKLTESIEYQLQRLEEDERSQFTQRKPAVSEDELAQQRAAIAENFNRLTTETSLLERVIRDSSSGVAVSATKRELWNKRLSQMNAETNALRNTIVKCMDTAHHANAARKERETRQRLLAGPKTGAHAVAMESLLTERTSLTSSHSMMDELSSVADNVVHALRDQRGVLKSAHKKVLDLATTLGLSNTLMRIIERRTTADKFLVYGGMVAIVAIILLVYWVTR